jgi:hypothetical protein
MHASKELGGFLPSKELTLVTLSYRQEQKLGFSPIQQHWYCIFYREEWKERQI